MNIMFLEDFGSFLRHSQDQSLYLAGFLERQLRMRKGTYEGRVVDIGSKESVYRLSSTNRRFIEGWEIEGIVVRGTVRKGNRRVIDV